jgi:uncharacterized RDD family membrane protein YckC
MDSLDPYRSSHPNHRKHLQKKFPQNPIRLIFAEFQYKLLAWAIDGTLLIGSFWLFRLHWTLWLVAAISYFTILEMSSLRASLGEYMAGIRIIHRSGRPMAWKHALSRNTAYLLTGGLSSLSSLFNKKGFSFHDQISHTLAIRETSAKE